MTYLLQVWPLQEHVSLIVIHPHVNNSCKIHSYLVITTWKLVRKTRAKHVADT